jgi:hypothetical protein
MTSDSNQSKASPSPRWRDALIRAGFVANGDGLYHHDNISFRDDGRWLQLETVANPPPPDVVRDLGRPGLWKHIAEGQTGRRVFEFPANAVCRDDEAEWSDDPTPARLDAFLAWALASEKDGVPPGWQAPERTLVESWMHPGDLTVQTGPIVRQGELILTPERWAIRFLIQPVVPADLPFARRDWLRAVLSDAQTRWRLVRLGFASEGENLAVACEVNLTGSPASENLFLAGLDGVRHVVRALVETCEVLCDATIASQLLKLAPSSNQNQERSQTA